MSSALKPALPTGGAASPTKAAANPAAQPPRGPPLVGQNLVHHQPTPAHPAQSPAHVAMSPVSQNMAQMAQNMSHHGNLSLISQNNGAAVSAPNGSPQSGKAAASAPVNLVQDRCLTGASQPLALTSEKKEECTLAPAQTNGTPEPNTSATTAEPVAAQDADKFKAEPNIPAKSPAKPVEASSAKPSENIPVKSPAKPIEASSAKSENSLAKADKSLTKPSEKLLAPTITENQLQVNKLGSSTDVTDKASPTKPKEGTEPPQEVAAAPIASTASSEPKLPDESANAKSNSPQEPTSTQATTSEPKISEPKSKAVAIDSTGTHEDASEVTPSKEPSQEVTQSPVKEKKMVKEAQKSPAIEEPKKVDAKETAEAPTVPAKKIETKTPATKSTMKLATVTPPVRKRRQDTPAKADRASSAKKLTEGDDASTPDSRLSKRNRTKVQPYQIPTPELAMATKLSASAGRSTPTKPGDDKLTVFYKNEYLAVRNAEGGFYVCQAMQNVYRSTRKIKIRWLSQDKTLDPSGNTYKPDFYDVTDMECVLTTLSLTRSSKGGGAQLLNAAEAARATSILERAISAEQSGQSNLQVTEEHPDGLDLSLYKDESQLEKKKGRKRKAADDKPDDDDDDDDDDVDDDEEEEDETPSKRSKRTPKKSPKSPKAKSAIKSDNNKRKSASGSTPVGNKTALVPDKATPKSAKSKVPTPAKKTPSKPAKETPSKPAKDTAKVPPVKATPPAQGKTPRKSDREWKLAALAATPSTSTGKATRTPRKPPSTKRSSAFILR